MFLDQGGRRVRPHSARLPTIYTAALDQRLAQGLLRREAASREQPFDQAKLMHLDPQHRHTLPPAGAVMRAAGQRATAAR